MIHLNDILAKIAERFPTQEIPLLEEHSAQMLVAFLDAISQSYGLKETDMVACYETFVEDTLEESRYFFEHDCYRCSTYKEADAYMQLKAPHYMRTYQIGLLLSLFIWPNHMAMRKHFIDILKEVKGKRYLEVGVGHGYYFCEAVAGTNYEEYLGVDINENSIALARLVLKSIIEQHPRKQCELRHADFFEMNRTGNKTYDAIICGEVLEHVENPERFLRKFSELSDENTLVYVTTAINAPAVDHISLFRSPDELRDLFERSGLKMTDMQLFLYKNKSLETCMKRKWPITVSIRAQKA